MTNLDATSPLVLSTKSLGRRAGSMLQVQRTAPAPTGWAVLTCEVPADSPVDLAVRLESVVEGVLVTGTAAVQLQSECSRCLDPVAGQMTVRVQQLFAYEFGPMDPMGETEQSLPVLAGELVDLEPLIRDAVILDLPMAPLCRPDCPGLCQDCGARLADDPDHRHDSADPRWSALQQWSASDPAGQSDLNT